MSTTTPPKGGPSGRASYSESATPATAWPQQPYAVPGGKVSRMSWGAVLAGTVIAVVVGGALNILGIAIGANLVDATARQTPDATTFGIGGGVWMLVSHMIGLGIGAYAAARLAGVTDRTDGVLHGLAMWATATLVGAMLLGSAASSAVSAVGQGVSGLVGGAAGGLGQLTTAVGGPVAGAAANQPGSGEDVASAAQAAVDRVQNALSASNADPAQMNSDQRRAEIGRLAARRIADGNLSQPDRDRLTALVAAEGDISQDEARNRIQQVEQETQARAQEAAEQARRAADAAASGAAMAAYWTFALLLLGAVVSAIASRLGTRDRATMEPAPARFR
ncbi:hypothetical protein ACFOD4_07295 [Pseudoroseomonas globiformis]|uniref:PhnA-like protein n=1 Tax=Teichococcus globiformis TaxID=2307229 RepID=A0ABV7FWU6_9PROT